MSHTLPHLTLTTSTSSLSPNPTYLPDNLTNTHKTFGTRFIFTLRCSTAKWRINMNPSLTGYEPKLVETEAIEPEDLEPRRIELDRSLGTDPYQRQERFMRNNYQNPIAEDMDEFGKVGAEMSCIQSQMHSDNDSAESTADSDLEDGELRKMLASPLYMQSRGDCKSSRIPTASGKPAAMIQERSKCEASSSGLERKLDVKFVSRTENMCETRCNVFIMKQRTGKPNQELCFPTR